MTEFHADPAGSVFCAALLHPKIAELPVVKEFFLFQLIKNEIDNLVGIPVAKQVLFDFSPAAGAGREKGDGLIQGAGILMKPDEIIKSFFLDGDAF